MARPTKKKVNDFLTTFKKLPETSQDKLLCIAYGMELATANAGGDQNERETSRKCVEAAV